MFVAQYFVCFRGDRHVYSRYLSTDEADPFVADIGRAMRFKDRAEAQRWLAQLGSTSGFVERLGEFSTHHLKYKQVAA
jgi:hypothetical protein